MYLISSKEAEFLPLFVFFVMTPVNGDDHVEPRTSGNRQPANHPGLPRIEISGGPFPAKFSHPLPADELYHDRELIPKESSQIWLAVRSIEICCRTHFSEAHLHHLHFKFLTKRRQISEKNH